MIDLILQRSKVIAFAGKGGVGKTTLCGMLVHHLCNTGHRPVIAVDADPNTNLNEVLGVKAEFTVSDVQNELKNSGIRGPVKGIRKDVYAEVKLFQSLTETRDYDLMTIGGSEGKGCYCEANRLLKRKLQKIQNYYPYVVIDNEAGMEHISRGLLPAMDVLILVSDCSTRGIQAAGRIAVLVRELEINPKVMGLVVNRAPDGVLGEGITDEIDRQNLSLIDVVSKDQAVYEYDCAGKPLVQIPEHYPVKQAIGRIVKKLGL